jgi:hypothetical protein
MRFTLEVTCSLSSRSRSLSLPLSLSPSLPLSLSTEVYEAVPLPTYSDMFSTVFEGGNTSSRFFLPVMSLFLVLSVSRYIFHPPPTRLRSVPSPFLYL